jgi:chromosome segregation ATPase
MKARITIIILVLVTLGLGIGLIFLSKQSREHREQSTAQILHLSNDVVKTRARLEEQQTVNLTLETNLVGRKLQLDLASNQLAAVQSDLAKTVADAKAAAEAAAAEVAKRDAKINELQGQNDEMTKKMSDLNGAITNLESQIALTEKKLAASEGDKSFLLKELKRLQAEKAQLEKQFNDLAVLRDQVRKLKDELSIARRLDWIRRGIYGQMSQKGAERLMNLNGQTNAAPASSNATLEVEMRPGQPAAIQSKVPTNAPAQK